MRELVRTGLGKFVGILQKSLLFGRTF
jgi:hypothetical protein